MSKRRHSIVQPVEVDNRERGIELLNRDGLEAPPAELEDEAAKLRALQDRISEAQVDDVILASDKAPHCRDCFRRGWRAALRAIEG